MSGATYRIDVELGAFSGYPWRATVTRISDENLRFLFLGDTEDEVLAMCRRAIRFETLGIDSSYAMFVNDDAEPVELHSVKA